MTLSVPFTPNTLTVTRPAAGSYSAAGVWTPGAGANFSIACNVQPLSGRELRALPEAFHKEEIQRVSTDTALQVGDTMTIDGSAWTVKRVKKHTAFGTHYVAFVARTTNP